jgi:hypothetical protein
LGLGNPLLSHSLGLSVVPPARTIAHAMCAISDGAARGMIALDDHKDGSDLIVIRIVRRPVRRLR